MNSSGKEADSSKDNPKNTETISRPTVKERIVRLIENHPLLALTIIIFSVLSSIVSFAVNLSKFHADTHLLYGAPDLANNYYARVTVTNEETAAETRQNLINLTMLAKSYQLANEHSEKRGYGFLSSEVLIGFEPDQIAYARHPADSESWIVGIDLLEGEGSVTATDGQIKQIEKAINYINMSFRDAGHPLRQELSKTENLLMNMESDYFSISDYETTYRIRLPRK